MKNSTVIDKFRPILSSLILFFFLQSCKDTKTTEYQSVFSSDNSSCISCHGDLQGFSQSHLPRKISCVACHLGDNLKPDKESAHRNMLVVPGDLSNASETCAKCHQGIDLRVSNSIMNTMSGVVSIDKYVFHENDNLDSLFEIHNLANITPAETHLRNKCASCHLGSKKTHPNPISEKSRGGGCTACHLNYSQEGKKAHDTYLASQKNEMSSYHPSLSLAVTDAHCFGCHSRSGRISTNYEGWHETQKHRDSVTDFDKYRVLQDKRVFVKQQEDVHHAVGMSCIDCHDADDTMGTGVQVPHKEQALHISCEDCHSDSNKTISFSDLDADDQRIVTLKKRDTTGLFRFSDLSNKALLNVVVRENENVLITKIDSKELLIGTPSASCTQEVHQEVSCVTCHTAWAPQCISCHTSFDAGLRGYDLLAKKGTQGKWVEKGNHYLADFPTLGVTHDEQESKFDLFSPGMVMTLEEKPDKKADFHRLFAPTSPHTIARKGKKCQECHNNSVALGYGRGDLKLLPDGTWQFSPRFPKSQDGLPEDAWIAFLSNDTIGKATRKNVRPLSLSEQKMMLGVGACLTCHKDQSKVVESMLLDFEKAKDNRKKTCIVSKFY